MFDLELLARETHPSDIMHSTQIYACLKFRPCHLGRRERSRMRKINTRHLGRNSAPDFTGVFARWPPTIGEARPLRTSSKSSFLLVSIKPNRKAMLQMSVKRVFSSQRKD